MLKEGHPIRLAGQDARRGTFSNRHAVIIDKENGNEWTPLRALISNENQFFVIDSLLSEYAAMGFEYGYSLEREEALVLWEGQFGDFANGAQTVVDEFISSALQKWGNLAEAHTDFIFAVVGEEMGLLGTLTLLGLFAFLLLSIFKIALRSQTLLERFFVSGVALWFAIQIVVNIGSVTGLIPVIGVTLPLVSYGGSSLIATLAGLGLVLGVAMRDPEVKSEITRKISRSLKYSQK